MADKGERTSLLAGGAQPQSGGGPAAGGKAATEQPLRLYLSAMPPSVCGLALGICSLGVTWQAAAQFLVAAGWLRVTADVISLVGSPSPFETRCSTKGELLRVKLAACEHDWSQSDTNMR
jgi:hypothetical protein